MTPLDMQQLGALFNAGRHAELEIRARELAAQHPQSGIVWKILGVSLSMQGKPALEALQRAVQLLPSDAEAHNSLGNALFDLRQFDEAETSYRLALKLKPDFAAAHNNRGNALRELGRFDDALESFKRALAIKPEFAAAHNNLGNALLQTGRAADAAASCRRALQIQPDYADAHSTLGNALRELGQLEDALQSCRRALQIQPDYAAGHNNLGNVLRELGNVEQAAASYRRALGLKPDFAAAHSNLGNVLCELAQYDAAVASCRCALEIQPTYAMAHGNLANALRALGQIAASRESYRRALELMPDNPYAHVNYAFLLLQSGEFDPGWREHEYRLQIDGASGSADFTSASRLADAELAGKSIMVHAEQGFGDTLQFMRYANQLTARGAAVYLLAPPELTSLARSCAGVAAVFAPGDALPPCDYHCPMLSLPLVCGTELHTIPADIPYLKSGQARLDQWREKIGARNGLRVGLAWAGNPRKHLPLVHAVDRQRSMHFDQLRPLLEIPGVEFFSLQLGAEAAAQLRGELRVTDFTADIRDFEDTAALMENLDLIICVDTSVAHLAGAIGKPVWLLNRYNTCWRWMSDRDDSPWYPTMRIFRQTSPGDWESVVGAVQSALAETARQFQRTH